MADETTTPPGNTGMADTMNDAQQSAESMAETMEEVNRRMGVGLERMMKQSEILRTQAKLTGDMTAYREQELKLLDSIGGKLTGYLQNLKQGSDDWDKNIAGIDTYIKKLEQMRPAQAARMKALRGELTKVGITAEEFESKMEEIEDLALGISTNMQHAQNVMSGAAVGTAKLASAMGITADASATASGAILNMGASLFASDDWAENFKSMGAALFDFVGPVNILSNLIDKLFEATFAMDAAAKGIGSATGITADFTGVISGTTSELAHIGVTAQDAGAAISALQANYSAFNPTAEAANTELVKQLTTLNKLGLSLQSGTQMIDHFRRSMNMSETEAGKMTTKIVRAGRNIGLSSQQMATDFVNMSKTLAAFGSQSDEVFLEFQAQAKASGIAANELLELAQGFDTFADAATKTAKLNAVLGTNLSGIQMINMAHGDRVNFLREELKAQVGNMENLDYYTQKLIAAEIAGGDVAKAQKLINMNTAQLADYNKDMETMAETQEKMAEAARKFVPILELIGNAFTEIANNPELMEDLAVAAQAIADGVVWLVELIPTLVEHWKAVLVVMGLVSLAWAAAKLKFAAWVVGVKTGAASTGPAVTGMLKMIGTGIIALGKAFLTGGAQIGAGGAAASPAIPIMTALAIASVALAIAFAAVAVAVVAVVWGIVQLFTLFFENAGNLPLVVMSLYGLAGGMAMLAMGAAGALAGAAALGLLSVGVMALKAAGILEIGAAMEAIGAGFVDMGVGIATTVSALTKLVKIKKDLEDMFSGDTVFMASSQGGVTSIVGGSSEAITNLANNPEFNVSVSIPELKLPDIAVYVTLDGSLLDDAVANAVADWLN
jgi:hypothetical protein